ncbi:YidC/Oxa1 family insertase periplasmic-domain containing protein [Gemmata sp. G18]|uniref:Membrane protein insertase YidC n=1 Tax=Gemmata palustris TaxID=2822762 RepID=A0ABS5C4S1_9BACT|nr:YidC/Oxa1 family insertase periplasmic-domain containing protein [Gemmata palustris]MBP3960992.1 YidC/Oxa1 family insertase periplasmic-domain containing protein [Gemmata palustris]
MRKNALNVVVFIFLAGGLVFLWQYAEKNWVPKPAKKEDLAEKFVEDLKKRAEEDAKIVAEAAEKKQAAQKSLTAAGGGLVVAGELPKPKPPEPPKIAAPKFGGVDPRVLAEAITNGIFDYTARPTLIALGKDTFYNHFLLTTQGGGVQQVVLPKFWQADRLGREVKRKDENGTPTKVPLYLVPGVTYTRSKQLREEYRVPDLVPGKVADPSGLAEPSYTVFHYPTPDDKNPDPFLGTTNWTVVSEERPNEGDHKVVFEKELGEPYFVKLRKTYTLGPKDYHVGLRVEIEKLEVPGSVKGRGQLRYQLSGPRGLPIEGEWYTSTYRVAITGWKDAKNTPRRQYEDSASIGLKRGGEIVTRGENTFKYMVVANQYFASGVAIDDTAEGPAKNPWAYVRATTEIPLDKKQDPNLTHFDDITVRAASETIDLKPGEKVSHSYLIYNGPSKVGLLELMPREGNTEPAVSKDLVKRYKDELILSTLTDFRSDTWIGRFASSIYWTELVITTTNLMHMFLYYINSAVGSWALSIVLLTACVRLVLLMPSRKQTAMSMKMMEVQKRLQPEFEKLQEKYKDDMHSYNREKTRLMMQHGANPFAMMGGCLLLVAQMPIMMGLYFGLQESIFFRLDSALWIDNLAAPDMLVWWGENIPFISTPEDIGSFIYLGPYFNLLPILAVGLMLYQQAKMMPTSTDPQAEQQRMMMKMMMVMMAVFFYKVAAGLALYFIVSTGWAIIERQFIPKPKIDGFNPDGNGTTANTYPKAGSPNGKSPTAADAVAAAQQKSKGLLGRLRERLQAKMEEMQRQADEQAKRQIRNDPNRPNGTTPAPGTGPDNRPNAPRRDKKKRKK